jgi:hypothetical protein
MVGLMGKPQVDGEGLERNQLHDRAKEEESWNEPFLKAEPHAKSNDAFNEISHRGDSKRRETHQV